ncbi:MAG: Gfo/Idh/MocA family oxidoreductase [Chloroflexi bacterium]|nr:Gfo/Idh/MocA family oxidoreductase [Chloroflexota bacterium]
MKALVLGCGSIGMRHVDHLLRLGDVTVEAADLSPAIRQTVESRFGVKVFSDAETALERHPDCVLICTPAESHVPVALQALDSGAHLFIEKPVSTDLDGLAGLMARAETSGKTVQVGYNLRFHPAMIKIKRMVETGLLGRVLVAHAEFGLYLDKWWPGRDYRQSYMAHADLGGGLLLDASHEIDSLMWFLGDVQEVSAMGGKLSDLEIDGADVFKVIMKMKSGAMASLHLDCLQPTYTRMYRLAGEDTSLMWDCPKGRADTSLGRLQTFDSGLGRFKSVRLRGDPQDTYVEELRDFLRCVRTGQAPLVGLEQGIRVIEVIEAIKSSIESGQTVTV